jgi:hypothetical protein
MIKAKNDPIAASKKGIPIILIQYNCFFCVLAISVKISVCRSTIESRFEDRSPTELRFSGLETGETFGKYGFGWISDEEKMPLLTCIC